MRLIQTMMVAVAVVAALCSPAVAQDWPLIFDAAATRGANMQVQVWDPDRTRETDGPVDPMTGQLTVVTVPDPGYVAMPLATLLDGLVTFPDMFVRYANVVEFDATVTMFDASDFPTMGVGVGAAGSLVVQMPGPPSSAVLVRYIMAIPVAAGDPAFVAAGPNNSGFNTIAGWAKQTGTVMLDGVECNVWYRTNAAASASFTIYLFLGITAQP